MIPYTKGDLKRALALCGLVGTWLVLVNQGSELAAGEFSATLYLRIILDYFTPFVVSSCTGVLRNWSDHKGRRSKQ